MRSIGQIAMPIALESLAKSIEKITTKETADV